jgi:hypothetical protein
MIPIPVPELVRQERADHRLVKMGPPPGVSDEDCGTAEMLIAPYAAIRGFSGRGQYVYYRPNAREIEMLNAGGCIEFCQYGQVVQPFSVSVWPES